MMKLLFVRVCLITVNEFEWFFVLKTFINFQMNWSTDVFALIDMICFENIRMIFLVEIGKTKKEENATRKVSQLEHFDFNGKYWHHKSQIECFFFHPYF